MSLVDIVQSGVQAVIAGIDRARLETAVAEDAAQRIAQHAIATGFIGVAQNIAIVREVIGQVQVGIGSLSLLAGQASATVRVVPRQRTPEETVAVLTPLSGKLDELRACAISCVAQIELAKQRTRSALQGAEPGAMSNRLAAIQQVLVTVNARVLEIQRHVEQAVIEARRIGDGEKRQGRRSGRSGAQPDRRTAYRFQRPRAGGVAIMKGRSADS
ncbi:DUF6244 family protein [Polymorphospora rubra]|uniref:DUF6244 family protein n=1 Tax=Polymorphospora rubra TaxID=338584 RepID=UPI0031E0861A